MFSITRSSDGDWFAFNDGLIARLNGDLTPDATFGENGVAAARSANHIPIGGIYDTNDTNEAVLADDQGRFVALDKAGLVRFD